jgi:hypothetical protein
MTRANATGKTAQLCSADHPKTREILTSVVRILLMGGETPEALVRVFSEVCRTVPATKLPWAQTASPELDYAHVISHWYGRPEYVDEDGRPCVLPLSGRGPSLTGLIRRVLPDAKPAVVLRSLEELGALRKEPGGYRPTALYVPFSQQQKDVIRWGLTIMRGVLHTIEHNGSSEPAERIPGRAAINPRFPVSALAGFYDRLREQASEFLRKMDADMHRKEMTAADETTTELGVAILAFQDPLMTGKRESQKKPRSRHRRVCARPRGKHR